MYIINRISKYICVKSFTVKDGCISFIFIDPLYASIFGARVQYESLSHQQLNMRLDEFELRDLWVVERTARYIDRHKNIALRKIGFKP